MKQHFSFINSDQPNTIWVTAKDDYSSKSGYGFFNERVRQTDSKYSIAELNAGFEVWDWYLGQTLTQIEQHNLGIFVPSSNDIPLCFKCNVPKQGNYKVTITISTDTDCGNDLFIFSGRRRLMVHQTMLASHSSHPFTFVMNVCDIIPRGYEEAVNDTTIDLSILGNHIYLTDIYIEEIHTPTIFIAGDSTVTDQPACYPYVPSNSYCGWGQMLPLYLNSNIALSNHAHSGLTSESFRTERHYTIVQEFIRKGDFLLIQFGHNDQKLVHLKAHEGYKENLRNYIEETIKIGALPVIVTPICRNSWKGSDGTYNDLLTEFATVGRELAEEYNIPVLDLHKHSYSFITSHGLEDSKHYFFPGDFTHTNDFGGYKMAEFLAQEMLHYSELSSLVSTDITTILQEEFIPPNVVEKLEPPEGLEYIAQNKAILVPVQYTDLDTCTSSTYEVAICKLAELGLLIQRGSLFEPKRLVTRVDALELVIKISNFFPTNVYNDMFHDVVGHEWYAGIVECAYSNGIIDDTQIRDSYFEPLKETTYYEFLVYSLHGYMSRKSVYTTKTTDMTDTTYLLKACEAIGILIKEFALDHALSKEECAVCGLMLNQALTGSK